VKHDDVSGLAFLQSGGKMGALMRAHDWSASPLGLPASWPQPLRSVVELVLQSKFPMFVAWGEDLRFLYNDAYAEILGSKHPRALGATFHDIWSEIWPDISPLIRAAMAGEATYSEDLPLVMNRKGFDEHTWFTFSYSPVRDETGRVAGIYCAVTETTHKVLAERRAERERARTVQLFDQAPGLICVLRGPDHVLEFGNAAVSALFGPRDWLGRPVREAFPDIEGQGFFELLDKVYVTGERQLAAGKRAVFVDLPDHQPREVFLDVMFAPLTNENGTIVGVFCQGQDVTERIRANNALRESEEQLRLATEAADVGLWDVDLVTDTLFWPPRVKAMFGISPHVPVSLADFYAGLHPEDRDFVSAEYAAAANPAIRSIYDVEYRTLGKEDGIERWVAAKGRGVFDDQGRCVRMIGTAIDITERKAAEERLRELNETLEQRVAAALAERNVLADLVEGTDAFVQVADPDYRFLAINKAAADEFERIFGVRPAVGDDMLALLADQPEQQAAVKRIWSRALAGEEFTEIGEFGDPARDRRFYEMKFNILRDHHGKTVGAYQFVHDVTEQLRNETRLKDAESVLRHAQKMEAVGQLTGGVAHDFNNLLMAISGGLRLIEKPLDGDKRERVLVGMRKAVERGASLTRQLLAFSRSRPPAAEPINLISAVSGMREFIDRSLGGEVQVAMNLPPDTWTIEADAGELELAVLNLCVNARDAMPGGGVIMIDAHNVTEADGETLREYVEFCMGDSGAGMSEEVVARACEPFFTTKEVGKGSGLGLAQVYAFVTSSGGAMTIDSKPGAGTTVRLMFPRSKKMPPEKADGAELRPSARATEPRTGHVLLVEDDREVAILSSEMLESIGFDVTHAGSAEAALGALKNGRPIDIVFSDVRMPGGMNGVDLAREIRRRDPRLPVVLTTGYAEGVREAQTDGFPVLPKPYQLEALNEILTRQLG
jgi:PAS domain S-box-containing protein